MSKQAFFLPSYQLIKDYTLRYAPTSIAVGAGAAGLSELAAMASRAKQDKELESPAESSSAPDTLVIPVPKVAQAPVPGAAPAPAPTPSPASVAAPHAVPHTEDSSYLLWKDPVALTAALAPGAITYGLLHRMFQNREQEDLRQRVEHSKGEYAALLSKELYSDKVASIKFPIIDGICKFASEMGEEKTASPLSTVLSAGTMVPLLSAVAGFKYMNDREKELSNFYNQKSVSPPKQVKIVSLPDQAKAEELRRQQQALMDADVGEDDLAAMAASVKGAGMLMNTAMGASLVNTAGFISDRVSPDAKIKRQLEHERLLQEMSGEAGNEPGTNSKIQQSTDNSVVMQTNDGPIKVDALDPNAVEFLNQHKNQLLDQLSHVYPS